MFQKLAQSLLARIKGNCNAGAIFNENWYSDEQIENLKKLVTKVMPLKGKIIEIGCWEGKSSVAISNVCYPQVLECIDTWKGNEDENPEHISCKIAKERDIFSIFKQNMQHCTGENFIAFRQDCFAYLRNLNSPVKFCHIDAMIINL
jgi:hypothetical protein